MERLLFACDEKFKETAQDYGFPSQIAAPYVFSETIVNLQKKIGCSAILNLPMYHKWIHQIIDQEGCIKKHHIDLALNAPQRAFISPCI